METNEPVANPSQPAANSPASASSEATSELERHSSFLGYRPGIEASSEEPEPSADVETTQDESETDTPEAFQHRFRVGMWLDIQTTTEFSARVTAKRKELLDNRS